MNATSLQSIAYPVYRLPSKPNVDEDVMYYYTETEKGGEVRGKLQLIDDRNVEGDTLAKRRLKIYSEGTPLYRLKDAIFFLGDLIKMATASTYFIDSNGKLFNYKKSTSVKLRYYKISKVLPLNTGGAIIEVSGLPSRFKVLNMPSEDVMCAGILHLGMSNILYGVYNHIPPDTRRMV